MSDGSAVRAGMLAAGAITGRYDDHSSQEGAKRLADRLAVYWACKGYAPPKFELVRISVSNNNHSVVDGSRLWCIRSDMLRGRPRPKPLLVPKG